jgi:hypothetical protein
MKEYKILKDYEKNKDQNKKLLIFTKNLSQPTLFLSLYLDILSYLQMKK